MVRGLVTVGVNDRAGVLPTRQENVTKERTELEPRHYLLFLHWLQLFTAGI